MYDNSKEALAYIMREYGADVLLGSRLKNFFNDYAPGVKRSRKNVVFFVIESGAAEILKRNIGAEAGEQEIAFRQAVQKVVEEYATERSVVENVMLEFTAALGWEVSVQTQKPQPAPAQQNQPVSEQPAPAPQNQPVSEQPAPAPQNRQTSSGSQTVPVKPSAGSLTPGQRNVSFGKYLWRVLDVQKGRALLLAEEILELRRYHSSYASVTWKDCELRGYLNGAFLQTFSSQEESRIVQTVNVNRDNPWYKTPGGGSTTDKVFLLSIEEVVKYFGDSGALRAGGEYSINDQYNSARVAEYGGAKAWWWWLRSPGYYVNCAVYVYYDGYLNLYGNSIYSAWGGVRPALWLNL